MATLIAKADGNLTGAATFATTDIGTALALNRNTFTTLLAAGTYTSSAFTVTTGAVIDAVLLWLKLSNTGASGTFKVDLQKGGVSQASVTVNKVDLPPYNGSTGVLPSPQLFKLATTATGDGAANWTIVITTTGGVGIDTYAASATVTNIVRALRTTTAATPAAGDNLYISGELTGAGTHNSRAVAMNSTAATAYGNATVNTTAVAGGLIAVTCWASLTYPTTAATNSILRVAGDLAVYGNCSLTIGSPGAEIPRDSTAVLEFQPVAADGDFGLRGFEGAVINIAGLSRTAGKNVTQCKMTSNLVSQNIGGGATGTNGTFAQNAIEQSGTSILTWGFTDNATSGVHSFSVPGGPSVTNQTQYLSIWLARGSGLNNRYVRLMVGNSATLLSVTNGFFTDIDLLAGTASGPTATGNGTATSVTISAEGRGYLVRLTGRVSTAATSPIYHVAACAVAGTVSYAGNSTQCFVWDRATYSNTVLVDTVVNVDTDTGWLAGDVTCLATTTQTQTTSYLYQLKTNADASSFTSAVYPSNYSGTAPTQAEIGLLTRNVKIKSTSYSLMAYVACTAQTTFIASWAEFCYLGANVSEKYGIYLEGGTTAVTNTKSITYCSIHDCEYYGVYCYTSSKQSIKLTFSNNVFWLGGSGTAFQISNAVSTSDWVVTSNLVMRTSGGMYIGDLSGGTFDNNTVAASTGYGFTFQEVGSRSRAALPYNNNTAHSCAYDGFVFGSTGVPLLTMVNTKAWRNGGRGISLTNTSSADLVFDGLTVFGNNGPTASNFYFSNDVINIRGSNNIICGDTSFPTGYGIEMASANMFNEYNIDNVDMAGGTGIFVPHVISDFTNTYFPYHRGYINNCKFGAPLLIENKGWAERAFLGFGRFNQVAGEHRCEMTYGQVRADNAIYRTTAPSLRMTPTSNTSKLESAPEDLGILSAVSSGNAITASVWIKKDVNYLSNQPRLLVRANTALGINNDTVLDTCTSPNSSIIPSTLDASTVASVTLSGGNLVATNTGTTSANQGVRVANAAGKTGGRFYFEVVLTTWVAGNNVGVGIATTASNYTNVGGSATTGAMVYMSSGNIWTGGGNSAISLGARASTNTICVAVDMDTRKIWFRPTSAGLWNANAANNPTTGVGGVTVPAGTMVPFLTFGGTSGVANNVFTANFGATPFIGVVPTGYLPGWGVADSGVVLDWVKMTGTTPVATDDGLMEFIVDCDGGSTGFINVDDWAFASSLGASTNELKYWFNGLPTSGGGGAGGAYFSAGFF